MGAWMRGESIEEMDQHCPQGSADVISSIWPRYYYFTHMSCYLNFLEMEKHRGFYLANIISNATTWSEKHVNEQNFSWSISLIRTWIGGTGCSCRVLSIHIGLNVAHHCVDDLLLVTMALNYIGRGVSVYLIFTPMNKIPQIEETCLTSGYMETLLLGNRYKMILDTQLRWTKNS